jgi:hypothetical protein
MALPLRRRSFGNAFRRHRERWTRSRVLSGPSQVAEFVEVGLNCQRVEAYLWFEFSCLTVWGSGGLASSLVKIQVASALQISLTSECYGMKIFLDLPTTKHFAEAIALGVLRRSKPAR